MRNEPPHSPGPLRFLTTGLSLLPGLLVGLGASEPSPTEKPNDKVHQAPIPTRPVDFDREISPLFSQFCLECHGPDAAARVGGFRLDVRESATTPAKSGRHPIVPGSLDQSEILQRIQSSDPDDRMPPPETDSALSARQIERLKKWVEEGAPYQGHWAFQPIAKVALPAVEAPAHIRQPLDTFIVAQQEAAGIHPNPPASRRVLIRRLYFDLIGLPPSPEVIEQFVNNPSPAAYEKHVDTLLASPRYGERWGRHWLDVARYGDSNGGDENHAYPHAYHYRNYVIEAFNRATPYDQFLQEQLAGDLLAGEEDRPNALRHLKATGFLAIGTKILAEQDPVKKRADTIDEQIDTFGRAVLGLTIACARCHDHKFDPIPTTDYYALAGIFHSTAIDTYPLETDAFRAAQRQHESRAAELHAKLNTLEARWDQLRNVTESQDIEAETFTAGNVQIDRDNFGPAIGIISDPGGQKNFAEYVIEFPHTGSYALELRYAAQEARPGKIRLNNEILTEEAFSQVTGGWHPDDQQWVIECVFDAQAGSGTLRLESEPTMVHIDRLRLVPLKDGSSAQKVVSELQTQRKALQAHHASAPKPDRTMAVQEGEIQNTAVHRRGSHNDLGAVVPRGALSNIGNDQPAIPPKSSGRLELARWLTHPKHPLTARVIANRIWRWHFGRGLVTTTDNFGTRGTRPTHPKLLDHLAQYLMDHQWSLKALHRTIVLSATYRLSSDSASPSGREKDPTNRLYWRRDRERLDAEAFRDALVYLAGRLDTTLGGGEMNVKSQDPSPEDLRKNQATYESSPRRSVYLPVVRSNTYDLLTLLDFPNAASPVGSRPTTTVATQALLLMNHQHIQDEAARIVDRHQRELGLREVAEVVPRLYTELFGRPPTDAEKAKAHQFIAAYQATLDTPAPRARQAALQAFCHTLVLSNEFAYVR